MSKPSREILELPIEKRAEIAFKVAVAKAIDEHTRLGLPVDILRNSRVVKLSSKKRRNSWRRPKVGFVVTTLVQYLYQLLLDRTGDGRKCVVCV